MPRQFMPNYTEGNPKRAITFTTTQRTYEALKNLADQSDVTISFLLNDVLHNFLSEKQPSSRD